MDPKCICSAAAIGGEHAVNCPCHPRYFRPFLSVPNRMQILSTSDRTIVPAWDEDDEDRWVTAQES